MKKFLFIFMGILIALPAYAALLTPLTPVEKFLLQKAETQKLTFRQSNLVVSILNKYASKIKMPINGQVNIKQIIKWLLSQ